MIQMMAESRMRSQISMLGPILWNITCDFVLRLNLPKGTQIIGFVDDIAVVIKGKHLDELVRTYNTEVGIFELELDLGNSS